MSSARLIRHSIGAIRRYKLRSAFIMLGSFVGSAALALVVSAGAGVERKMLATVRQLFSGSSIVIMAGGTQLIGGPAGNASRLTLDDLEAIAGQLPEIAAWDPQQAIGDGSVRHGGVTATARIVGASERAEHVWQRTVTRGEHFDANSVKTSARVAMIGETTAKELFGAEDPLDAEIL